MAEDLALPVNDKLKLLFSFDLKKYEKAAKAFANQAKRKGKVVYEKVVGYQKKLLRLAAKLEAGEIDRVSARRVQGTYRRAIRNYLEASAEWANWEKFENFDFAISSILDVLQIAKSAFIVFG